MDTGPASHSRLTRPPPDAQATTPKQAAQAAQAAPAHIHSPPDRPSLSLSRLPSASSAGTSGRSRRASQPVARTPTTTTAQPSPAATPATTPSYFSPQQPSDAKDAKDPKDPKDPKDSSKDVRSPGTRRPPAFSSSFGKAYGDTSRGPPISVSGTWPKQPTPTRSFSIPTERMAAQAQPEASPAYDAVARPRLQTRRTTESRGDADQSGAEDGGEDLFLNIAEDSAKDAANNAASRSDRVRSRIARNSNRQSLPSSIHSSSPAISNQTRPNGARVPAAIDTSAGSQFRRTSFLPSSGRTTREHSPLTPANPVFAPRARIADPSPRTRRSTTSLARDQNQESKPNTASVGASSSFTAQLGVSTVFSPQTFMAQVEAVKARQTDSTLSPKEFLAQLESEKGEKRRPSVPDITQITPSNRIFKPSNLHFHSSSRDNPAGLHIDTPPEARSRNEGTESHGSTGPATSMWDELDELKSRMKRLEMGGKIPATSGAAVAQASADRPRTANTSATTVSSSPNQQKKPTATEPTISVSTPSKVHPLLQEALAKVRPHISPSVYRALESTASEAISLAEMAGSGGPQGTSSSANFIPGSSGMPDRQVRRKADHICRNLTDLCIELYDGKSSFISPAVQRTSAATVSRRPSLQINGESPTIRKSIEPESDALTRSSPSRAMSRIEARRTSIMNRRESSLEPPTPSQSHLPSRFDSSRLERSGTSLYRRRTVDRDDDEPTLRAPSRAMTDFRNVSMRTAHKSRFSREYTSQEPLPDLQPSPALQTPASRRTTVLGNENSLLLRDREGGNRTALGKRSRYGLNQMTPAIAYDKYPLEPVARTQAASNRASIGGSFPLGRSASLTRRQVNAE